LAPIREGSWPTQLPLPDVRAIAMLRPVTVGDLGRRDGGQRNTRVEKGLLACASRLSSPYVEADYVRVKRKVQLGTRARLDKTVSSRDEESSR
ncbi:MAG: hypothetical protein U9Q95_01315, partial [Candidatus Eisenbacteria bacterium]|nr:hypothetical protein [Candidatus Eisenbacteria bacterium]